RDRAQVDLIRNYYKAQGLFGIPNKGDVDYTTVLELDLASVRASVAGPKRPQDRIELDSLKEAFAGMLQAAPPNGYCKTGPSARKTRAVVGVGSEHLGMTIEGGGAQLSAPTPQH